VAYCTINDGDVALEKGVAHSSNCTPVFAYMHLADELVYNFRAEIQRIGSRSKVTVNKCVSRTDTNPPFAFDISPFFCPPGGLLTPQRGEDTSGTRVRQHAKFGVNRPAGCREIVDKKADKKTKNMQ